MKKIIILYILIFSFLNLRPLISLENKIIFKINNEIITTFDVNQEQKYLKVLNQNLKKLDQNKLKSLATDSLIKEKIKEIELVKYYQIEKVLNNANLNRIVKNLYQNAGFQSEKEFKNYLDNQNLLCHQNLFVFWQSLVFYKNLP